MHLGRTPPTVIGFRSADHYLVSTTLALPQPTGPRGWYQQGQAGRWSDRTYLAIMDTAHQLGGFLRSRRSRLTPEAVGLPDFGPRRVPGLRREEVAALAGVSAVYYVRLEQGRAANPSDAVLEALVRVLRLDETERSHLYDLARPPRVRTGNGESAQGPQPVRPALRRLLDAVDAVPAYVLGPNMDVLAANHLARGLIISLIQTEPGNPNLARHIFLDPAAPERYPQWPQVARQTVAFLRFAAGRHGHQPRFTTLIAELQEQSAEFRRLWAAQDVEQKTHGTKHFNHPLVGEFGLSYETLSLPGDDGQALVVFAAEPGGAADTALKLLGSWTAATPREDAGRP